jgi:hypothetical protein
LQIQNMSSMVAVPATLAHTHMPELVEMAAGTSSPIQLQLVLLPPHASDITPGGLLQRSPASRLLTIQSVSVSPVWQQVILHHVTFVARFALAACVMGPLCSRATSSMLMFLPQCEYYNCFPDARCCCCYPMYAARDPSAASYQPAACGQCAQACKGQFF